MSHTLTKQSSETETITVFLRYIWEETLDGGCIAALEFFTDKYNRLAWTFPGASEEEIFAKIRKWINDKN